MSVETCMSTGQPHDWYNAMGDLCFDCGWPRPPGVIPRSPESGPAESRLLADVRRAWADPGVAPDYHRWMQDRLRREWPVLAHALDRLDGSRR